VEVRKSVPPPQKGSYLDGCGRALILKSNPVLPGWTAENLHSYVRIGGVVAKIRKRHLPNISLQCHSYTNLRSVVSQSTLHARFINDHFT
jgi:hypothetical protein